MSNRKLSIGSWITLGHFSIAEILADAGFDWLCIDLEHTAIDFYEAAQLICAIQSKGLPAFVRVSENDRTVIKRVLDAGANGIIVPMVCTKEDAMKAVESSKYPPTGNRGVALARAQKYGFGFDNYAATANSQIKVIAQIEHIDAIRNLRAILEVDGLDGTFIGPYDLSGSLGKPGNFDDAEVKKAIETYEDITMQYDKLKGFHVVQPDYRLVLEKIDRGYDFIAFSVDFLFLGTLCRDQVRSLREKVR
jgi:2-keto-3-deoxy-L-rhamnonate aldolase RhmA